MIVLWKPWNFLDSSASTEKTEKYHLNQVKMSFSVTAYTY